MNYEQFLHENNWTEKKIFLVNMTQEENHYFSQLMMRGIAKSLHQGKRVAVIVNKKWYSNGVICHDCGYVPQCRKCSVSIGYHKTWNDYKMWLCHICKEQYEIPTKCNHCGSKQIRPFGMWTQQVAEYLEQEFDCKTLLVESEKANSFAKIQRLREQLKESKNTPQILVWTSLLRTAIPEYPLDLVIFLNADLGLNIPDYNAAEKNFLFLYDAFVKHEDANFIVQSFNPDHYSIRNACKMDMKAFTDEDLIFRKTHGYPPFADLCVILYKHDIEERLFTKVDTLYKELLYLKEKYQVSDIEIYSTPPLIYKIFGKYRYNIILKWPQLRNFMDIVYTKLNLGAKWFKINRNADTIV